MVKQKLLMAGENDLYLLLKLTIPLVLTGIMQSSVFFFETLFLAHVSAEVLAAGALVSWLFGTFAGIVFGTLSAINVLVSHKYGANDHAGIALVMHDGLWLALLLTPPSFLLFWHMPSIFLLFGQSAAIVLLAKSYLHALAWGIFPNFIMITFLELIIGLGHARIIMIFSLLSVSLNIFFSYIFIFGKFGFPALGIAGAGWGMTLSYWIAAIGLMIYVLTNKKYNTYFHSMFSFKNPHFLWELLQVGVPMGAMYCIEVAFFFALTLFMGSLGSQLLAANQIAFQYMCVFMTIIFSIAQAITVRMGHLLGEKNTDAAARAGYTGICLSGIFMSIVAMGYWVFPGALISLDFNVHDPKNREIVYYAEQFLAVSAIFQIIESIRISFFGALRSLKDTHFTLFTSFISFWCIALPVGYWLATRLHVGGTGLWWGMVMGTTLSVLLLHWRFKSKIRLYY